MSAANEVPRNPRAREVGELFTTMAAALHFQLCRRVGCQQPSRHERDESTAKTTLPGLQLCRPMRMPKQVLKEGAGRQAGRLASGSRSRLCLKFESCVLRRPLRHEATGADTRDIRTPAAGLIRGWGESTRHPSWRMLTV